MGWDGYTPDSTNYKTTASGAKNAILIYTAHCKTVLICANGLIPENGYFVVKINIFKNFQIYPTFLKSGDISIIDMSIILFILNTPTLPPSPGHLCAVPVGTLDCHYAADHCCCGFCAQNFTLSCVPDSTSGAGHWQSTLCPIEGCGSEGGWWR